MENNEERFKIIPFEEKYLEDLKTGIRNGWNANHVLQKSDKLLQWQYHGFGQMAGMKLPLLFDGDKMIGYRLMIPIEIMLSDKAGNHTVIPSAVSTLFFVDKDYRGMKLGLKLQLYTIEHYGGYFAIASNLKTSAPIYKKSGAKMLDTMYRYVRPLSEGMKNLLIGDAKTEWSINAPQSYIAPVEANCSELASAWKRFIGDRNVTTLNRSEEFWRWRYKDSPIYKYYTFKSESGYVVGRICDLYNDVREKTDVKVFRVLEFIPSDFNVWNHTTNKNAETLIDGVCGWAKEKGCVAAEFYMSSSRFDKVMEKTGFKEINKDENTASSVMSYFEPCDTAHRLSNVSIQSSLLPDDFDFEDTYFTLSDADQDRPNII